MWIVRVTFVVDVICTKLKIEFQMKVIFYLQNQIWTNKLLLFRSSCTENKGQGYTCYVVYN
jgi:hypothetical protein